ncbi:NADH-quinone oxidoreductase subunit C [Fimbriimonadia bacterium ATM]|nr:MAG: NADH-quinone oxidoreductase subunit C [Armatimonadota bacterium]MBC6970247.1 NADH-quinone oxidoreductase subunit C [Armatimonadota bacterium]MCE7899573.1 NADH-quinone oxidoreductase subunit C [Armatimonadetes bacterium ATM1]MDL1927661.1 NADH-quinone oxidoreductase subunit C [Fimbriimonadia bacterium ATM]RIJ96413.1 MAG: NADH-quinone oxidoreductase subunit C [Armatimonadota bacterium]
MPIPIYQGERLEVVCVRERFPNAIIRVKEYRDDTFICVDRESIADVATFLRDDERLQYTYFVECTCVDYSSWPHERDLPGRFEVIYNLYSLKYRSRIFLKIGVDDGQEVPTLVGVYPGAEYPEREVWDLYGVRFRGHPKLHRFLLPDDWVGHPLRKDFPLGGEDVVFAQNTVGPAVEDESVPHAGESFEGRTGSEDVSGR